MPRVLLVICHEGQVEGRAVAVTVPTQLPQHSHHAWSSDTLPQSRQFESPLPPNHEPLSPAHVAATACFSLAVEGIIPTRHLLSPRQPHFRRKWLAPLANPCPARQT